MENLLKCDGRRFKATIKGIQCEGKISVIDGSVFLCQNKIEGDFCSDKLGYKYSWGVSEGSMEQLAKNDVYLFSLSPRTAAEIEAYKDWHVGDKMTQNGETMEVIFRSGKLVVCELRTGEASNNFTCDELYDDGWRLVADQEPEDETVELTMDEIAKKVGIPVENGIKKKRWRAIEGDSYYFLRATYEVGKLKEMGNSIDDAMYLSGNYFRTKEEAEDVAAKFKEILKERM